MININSNILIKYLLSLNAISVRSHLLDLLRLKYRFIHKFANLTPFFNGSQTCVLVASRKIFLRCVFSCLV
jgi:hypothetical protein